jgi:PIN domain nuclease of toxin-antitoxin system
VNLLLDTHVFIWWDQGNTSLIANVRAAIEEPRNSIYVSAVTVWEIAIKRRLGKLAFAGSACEAIASNGFLELPVLPREAEAAGDLAWQHGDPFDRLLVAQAMGRGLILVTGDEAIRGFDVVPRLWAR